jgi:predicted RNase H-like HicB family nuclease
VGVAKIKLVIIWSPSPSSPPTEGRGNFIGDGSKVLETNSHTYTRKNLTILLPFSVKFSNLICGGQKMVELEYSLVIEATEEPDYFGFYSPDLQGFTGIGHSVEDCLYKAKWGMIEHINLLREGGLPIPPKNPYPKIIIQNEQKSEAA